MSSSAAITGQGRRAAWAAGAPAGWTRGYLRTVALSDGLCAVVAGLLAFQLRFGSQSYQQAEYLAFTVALPVLWVASIALARGYDPRFIGVGSDEFRRVLSAAVSLTAGVAVVSYATAHDLARGYVVIALPCAAAFALTARYHLRKHLHRRRRRGHYMRRTVAVGHATAVAGLVALA